MKKVGDMCQKYLSLPQERAESGSRKSLGKVREDSDKSQTAREARVLGWWGLYLSNQKGKGKLDREILIACEPAAKPVTHALLNI